MGKITLPYKTLVALGGLQFTGKTTLGCELHSRLNAHFIPVDAVRVLLFGKTAKYKDNPREDVYQLSLAYPTQGAVADALLGLGDSVIVEGTLSRRSYQNTLVVIARKHAVPLKVIMLYLPEDKEVAALETRAAERLPDSASGAVSPDDYFRVKARFEWPELPHIKIDTTRPIDICIEEAVNYLLTDP